MSLKIGHVKNELFLFSTNLRIDIFALAAETQEFGIQIFDGIISAPYKEYFSELQIIEVNENSSPAFSDSFSAQLNGPMTPNPTQNNLAVPNKSASQFSYNTLGEWTFSSGGFQPLV